ncbi:MAG: hypothetical protein ACF8OB_06830 [Phycisphaeraceae bacterium JB051]
MPRHHHILNHTIIIMKHKLTIVLLALFTLTSTTFADSQRFWLANYEKWSAKQGFTLHLENKSKNNDTMQLKDMALVAGVGTGKVFRYANTRPQWELNRTYQTTFIVTDKDITLVLDGKTIKTQKAVMSPAPMTKVTAANAPSWANKGRKPDYQIIQHQLVITPDNQPAMQVDLLSAEDLKAGNLWRFNPAGGGQTHLPFQPKAGQSFTINATFTIIPRVPVDQLPVMIDTYGQAVEAAFPGKVKTDSDLVAKWEDEKRRLAQMPPSTDYDRFGGYLKSPWKEQATGYYRTIKRDGKFWLITPQGNPCFYLGMCTVPSLNWPATGVEGRENLFAQLPPRTGLYKDAWTTHIKHGKKLTGVCFHAANMARKYGQGWQETAKQMAVQRLASFGFHGIGKWGGSFGDGAKAGGISALPVTPVIYWRGVPTLHKMPDVFDEDIRQQCYAALEKQIKPHLNNPLIVGWSIGNEKHGIVWPEEIQTIFTKDAKTAAKRALIDHALQSIYQNDLSKLTHAWKSDATSVEQLYADTQMKLPKDDFETLRQYFANAYHAFAYKTVKTIDPNHLYLSYWVVPGWWVNDSDWMIGAKHCDVVGYDRYALQYADERMLRLLEEADKPTMVGEFNFPADYEGKRGYGSFKVSTQNENEMGQTYQQWVRDAATSPYCVGLLFFHYRDQPLTGRSLGVVKSLTGGEHYAFGIVDITDTPKWDLVMQMREANLKAAQWRLGQER